MHNSFLGAGLRAFFISLFTVMGICAAILPSILLLSMLVSQEESAPDSNFNIEILPNAQGVRTKMEHDAPVILEIPISGIIGAGDMTQEHIRKMLVESRESTLKNNRVKALFITIASPGGTVLDADGIYRAIKAYKEQYQVPVYAYVDGLCASGGMYIASAADKIYASDVSLIGSVGVIAPSFLNYSTLLNALGVQSMTLYAGKGKDTMNPLRPWKPDEQAALQQIIDHYYDQFVSIVAEARPALDKEKLVADYGAHIYPAALAAQYGYVDASGFSRNEALKMLLDRLAIQDEGYQVVAMTSDSWYHKLFKDKTWLLSGTIKHEIHLGPLLDPALQGKFLYLYTGTL